MLSLLPFSSVSSYTFPTFLPFSSTQSVIPAHSVVGIGYRYPTSHSGSYDTFASPFLSPSLSLPAPHLSCLLFPRSGIQSVIPAHSIPALAGLPTLATLIIPFFPSPTLTYSSSSCDSVAGYLDPWVCFVSSFSSAARLPWGSKVICAA